MVKDLYIYGAGGFGRELRMVIEQINKKQKTWNIIGFIDDEYKKNTKICDFLKVEGDFDFLNNIEKHVDVAIAIGESYTREKIFKKLKSNKHINFPNIFHPSVVFDKSSIKIGIGNIFLINVIISNCVKIGDFNIVNMASIIGHDVKSGNFVTINPSVNIGGGVIIGNNCEFGMGSSTIQYLSIPSNVKIAGNSLVTQNCESGFLYLGIPAKKTFPVKKNFK